MHAMFSSMEVVFSVTKAIMRMTVSRSKNHAPTSHVSDVLPYCSAKNSKSWHDTKRKNQMQSFSTKRENLALSKCSCRLWLPALPLPPY